MTDYYVRGQSQTFRPGTTGGGEGPWYWDAGCNEVVLPGDNGDPWVVWAAEEPAVTGNADLSGEVAFGVWMLTFNGAGPVTLNGTSIIAHSIGNGNLIVTDCA